MTKQKGIIKQLLKTLPHEAAYIMVLGFLIITNPFTDRNVLIVRGGLIVVLWVLPAFLNLRYKMVNTLILAGIIRLLTASLFNSTQNRIECLTVVVAIMMFVALVLNIFMVIGEFYRRKETVGRRLEIFKLMYVLGAFALLIYTLIMGYAQMYENIYTYQDGAFNVGFGVFSPVYFSSTTYFTVGYGDTVPVSQMARWVTLSQMVFAYVTTCLIIPTILVSFQKLFEVQIKARVQSVAKVNKE